MEKAQELGTPPVMMEVEGGKEHHVCYKKKRELHAWKSGAVSTIVQRVDCKTD